MVSKPHQRASSYSLVKRLLQEHISPYMKRIILAVICMITVATCIAKSECEWMCFQNCSSSYYHPSSEDEDITQFCPSVNLSFLFSFGWLDITNILQCASIFHKHVSELTIVFHFNSINRDLISLLDFISKNKNNKYSKCIKILFTIYQIVCRYDFNEHNDKVSCIFEWCTKNFNRVSADDGINEFTFGIISIGDKSKRAHVFNLKKCYDTQQIGKWKTMWDTIVFTRKNVDCVETWWTKFNGIKDSIPRN